MKNFTPPTVEVCVFIIEDVITTSGEIQLPEVEIGNASGE